ncbi:LysE/ArgO family amino acid transporter [Bacillus sp. FJAT-26390]|uniref:LysE/ArgO family amino acid transporter n=1 Tax=Bacillus sp. FJAT-26390 TaxID=1743142 RepID=UPI000808180B|nr:LysE/ArgO family amino acid transporter [Bacillus sp. FJAT-26390]OBZ09229.1 lysine transporter LysE [Bacillus sp. FJAT-26390]
MEATLHGILLAFGLILPLGVQNIFIFTQGATQPNLFKALPATLTAALCDTLLILFAVFGLSVIVLQFAWLRLGLMIIGIIFLLYMGYSVWNSRPAKRESGKSLPPQKQIVFALSVSLLNPHAILDTVGVIGTSALRYAGLEQILFTATCIAVSWCWFFGLTIAGAFIKKLDGSGPILNIFNKFSAIFIWLTALLLLKSLFA